MVTSEEKHNNDSMQITCRLIEKKGKTLISTSEKQIRCQLDSTRRRNTSEIVYNIRTMDRISTILCKFSQQSNLFCW